MTKYRSDTTILRDVLGHHGVWTHNERVYNDHSKRTPIRRLKYQAWNCHKLYGAGGNKWDVAVADMKAAFGSRFVKMEFTPAPNAWVCPYIAVYLDDSVAPPPARPVNPNKRKTVPRPRPSPEFATSEQHYKFWSSAVTKPFKIEQIRHGVIRTLAHDVCAFKKVQRGHGVGAAIIANLIIPKGTQVHITASKCRSAKARVHSLAVAASGDPVDVAYARHDHFFAYETGKVVKPSNGFARRIDACAGGIHFFLDPYEAYRW